MHTSTVPALDGTEVRVSATRRPLVRPVSQNRSKSLCARAGPPHGAGRYHREMPTTRMWRRAALIWLAALRVAHADGLDGERFVPSVGAEGTFVDEHPAVPSHLGFGLGLFVNYAADQIVVRDGAGNVSSHPLRTGLTADLTASLGLLGWAELGIGLPLHLVYDGDTYTAGTARLD